MHSQALQSAEESLYETRVSSMKDDMDDENLHQLIQGRVLYLQQQQEKATKHAEDLQADLQASKERIEELENGLQHIAKDCIDARLKRDAAELALTQSKEASAITCRALKEALMQAQQETEEATKRTAIKYQRESTALKHKIHEQDKAAKKAAAEYATMKSELEHRIQTLEKSVTLANRRHEKLEKQRSRDVAGWNADLCAMRRRVTATDRRLRQVLAVAGASHDEDLAEAVAARWDKMAQKECGREDSESIFSSLTESGSISLGGIAHELALVKACLAGMSQRCADA